MRQIIQIQVGRCGNQIGSSFWETISQEHNIDATGKKVGRHEGVQENLDVFYDENRDGSYSARAILVDLEPGIIDSVLASKYSQLYRWENTICGRGTASNNFAKGYYTEGSQYIDYVTDAMRRQAQRCESLEAFQIVHSIGGGTGSGMGCLIVKKILEWFPWKMVENYTVFPSHKVSDTVIEPYNAALSFPTLMSQTTKCISLDNQALFEISSINTKSPTYKTMNDIISLSMSGLTCGTRFSGQLTASLRKITNNTVPFPKVHFFVTGCATFMLDQNKQKNIKKKDVLELTNKIFDKNNIFCRAQVLEGRHISASIIYRGQISPYQVQRHMLDIQNVGSSYFVSWLPNNIQSSICHIPHNSFKTSATYLANTTSINKIFKQQSQNFSALFKRRAFLHWYAQEGMEQTEFMDAEEALNDLISVYQRLENQPEPDQGVIYDNF